MGCGIITTSAVSGMLFVPYMGIVDIPSVSRNIIAAFWFVLLSQQFRDPFWRSPRDVACRARSFRVVCLLEIQNKRML